MAGNDLPSVKSVKAALGKRSRTATLQRMAERIAEALDKPDISPRDLATLTLRLDALMIELERRGVMLQEDVNGGGVSADDSADAPWSAI